MGPKVQIWPSIRDPPRLVSPRRAVDLAASTHHSRESYPLSRDRDTTHVRFDTSDVVEPGD